MRLRVLLGCLAALIAGCASHPAHDDRTASELDEILASDHRSQENQARDAYRHPAETLRFFGIEPEMTVVEVWPDEKNYEKGVWALPPTFAAGDEDRRRYIAIGESDRFTLKFRKRAQ